MSPRRSQMPHRASGAHTERAEDARSAPCDHPVKHMAGKIFPLDIFLFGISQSVDYF